MGFNPSGQPVSDKLELINDIQHLSIADERTLSISDERTCQIFDLMADALALLNARLEELEYRAMQADQQAPPTPRQIWI